jgi:hypothetical protein
MFLDRGMAMMAELVTSFPLRNACGGQGHTSHEVRACTHVIFTLPHDLSPLALHNPRHPYGILFRTVAQTLQDIAGDPKHLGAEIGGFAVLHTWGQQLHLHQHS